MPGHVTFRIADTRDQGFSVTGPRSVMGIPGPGRAVSGDRDSWALRVSVSVEEFPTGEASRRYSGLPRGFHDHFSEFLWAFKVSVVLKVFPKILIVLLIIGIYKFFVVKKLV